MLDRDLLSISPSSLGSSSLIILRRMSSCFLLLCLRALKCSATLRAATSSVSSVSLGYWSSTGGSEYMELPDLVRSMIMPPRCCFDANDVEDSFEVT